MAYQIEAKRLNEVISRATLLDDGDQHERANCQLLRDTFPNFEVCWKHFVVPFTKRIEGIEDPKDRIEHRDGVDQKIKDLGITHYSLFLNLVYANDHLQNPGLASFEDFYMHLVAACDLAEEFLMNAYLLILECVDEKCEVLQCLSREEFLLEAGRWYDNKYHTLYEVYKRRGNLPFIGFPPNREHILDEYFDPAVCWNEYKAFTKELKPYRNAVVHRSHIMRILDGIKGEETRLVPRKARVQQYKTWTSIKAAARDKRRRENDFVPMKEQMRSDIEQLTTLLNGIWSKPVEDMRRLLCEDRNTVLLAKYDLSLRSIQAGNSATQEYQTSFGASDMEKEFSGKVVPTATHVVGPSGDVWVSDKPMVYRESSIDNEDARKSPPTKHPKKAQKKHQKKKQKQKRKEKRKQINKR